MALVEINHNDEFQWKKSSHKQASLGLGLSTTNTNDNTDRDTVTARDVVEQLLRDAQLDNLENLVTDYFDHFDTGITFTNREATRELADCIVDYAKDQIYSKVMDTVEDKLAEEDRRLERELCASIARLNSIGGSTRNSFSQHVIADTLSDHAIQRANVLAETTLAATQLELQAYGLAFDAKYRAYIQADHLDFEKYLGMLQILRGSHSSQDFDETVDDVIDRDIDTTKLTVQYNRTAGSISDADGTYDNEYNDLLTAGGAALIP